MKLSRLALALAVCIVANVATARAAVFDFTFTDGVSTSGSGEFTTSDVGSPFLITGVSGTFSYMGAGPQTITGIESVGGYAGNDNLLSFPGTPAFLTYGGLSFTTASDVYNIGFSAPFYYMEQQSTNSVGSINPGDTFVQLTDFTVTAVAAVPEPSTWAMMILGFCTLGFIGYRRRAGQTSIA
jgi:hypothetical protein